MSQDEFGNIELDDDPSPEDLFGASPSMADEDSESEIAVTDPNHPQTFGRTFVEQIYKILKIGSIYEVQHNQTRMTASEFIDFFNHAMSYSLESSFSISIRDELAVVNGENLRLKRRAQTRLNELRDLFASANIRGLVMYRAMSVDDLLNFLDALRRASKTREGMEDVEIDNIDIDHGEPTRNIIEAVMDVNKAMYVCHLYLRGLVKMKNLHAQVRERMDPEVPTGIIRRIIQSVSDLLADEDFTILGLMPLRLVAPDLSTHSMNSAIYAMLIGDRLGLEPALTTYLGMSMIYQDLDRIVGITVSRRDQEQTIDPQQQFSMNLRDVAKMLDRVEGDIVSTLRVLITYERGCAYDQPIASPFYRNPRQLHLATRIIDICRTYDLLIQGLEGYKTRRPDLAIEYIQSRSGEIFDEALVELMISTLGIYPIGTTVLLSSGEKAVVIKTPDPTQDQRRPICRILSLENPRVIDLSEPKFQSVDILKAIEVDPGEISVSKVFLLT